MSDISQAAGQINTLDLALNAVEQRPFLYLFPVHPLIKGQPLLADYLKAASNKPEQLKRWHAYWKKRLKGLEIWWGIAPGLSGLVFADVDTKIGKPGEDTFGLFEQLYGWPDTRVIGSPSGGRHHWYRGKQLFAIGRANTNHPGIDFAQYVLLPGCMKPDGTGYTVREEREIADAPEWFYVEAKPRGAPDADASGSEPVIDEDQDAAIEWATSYLLNEAPLALEGAGGDDTTMLVGRALRDMGISEPMALDLMLDNWNARCEPPWDFDDLKTKVANVFKYARFAPGSKSAEADFFPEGIPEQTPEEKAERLAKTAERRKKREAVAKPETFASLRENYVYIGQQRRWVREADAMIWDPLAFDAYFSNLNVPDKNTSTAIGTWILRMKKDGVRRKHRGFALFKFLGYSFAHDTYAVHCVHKRLRSRFKKTCSAIYEHGLSGVIAR